MKKLFFVPLFALLVGFMVFQSFEAKAATTSTTTTTTTTDTFCPKGSVTRPDGSCSDSCNVIQGQPIPGDCEGKFTFVKAPPCPGYQSTCENGLKPIEVAGCYGPCCKGGCTQDKAAQDQVCIKYMCPSGTGGSRNNNTTDTGRQNNNGNGQ